MKIPICSPITGIMAQIGKQEGDIEVLINSVFFSWGHSFYLPVKGQIEARNHVIMQNPNWSVSWKLHTIGLLSFNPSFWIENGDLGEMGAKIGRLWGPIQLKLRIPGNTQLQITANNPIKALDLLGHINTEE